MKCYTSQEQKNPNPKSLRLVDELAASMQPHVLETCDWFNIYVEQQRRRIAHDIDYVQKHVRRGENLLDIGALPFLLTGSLEKLGYDVCGVDIEPERSGFAGVIANLNLTVHKCNIEVEKLPFQDKEFDIVIFNEIFEHLRINLIFTMREVHRVLRTGGTLMLSTPNLRSLKGVANFLCRNRSFSCRGDVYDEYKTLEAQGCMGHVREYTSLEVQQFLESMGFMIKEIIFRGIYSEWYWTEITIKLLPKLRPFMTIIATKKGSQE